MNPKSLASLDVRVIRASTNALVVFYSTEPPLIEPPSLVHEDGHKERRRHQPDPAVRHAFRPLARHDERDDEAGSQRAEQPEIPQDGRPGRFWRLSLVIEPTE